MKYKRLIYLFPKYAHNYKERKAGDILESAVTVMDNKHRTTIPPNDPTLLEREVISMLPIARSRYYSWTGSWIITVK